ncbi:hypothetical protein Tsubulata_033921 [Turnera subulata]|uniref:Beta-glucosidase n=1 Tax=Turnera subulata TaxID=218843 RepID=A0A9Q0GJ56_9ROSI|nr:hypothetical protein Tsubulata_033921 [Turnera subulata]
MLDTSVLSLLLCLSSLALLLHPSLAVGSSHDEEEVKRSQFPYGFFFGTSTSSYQVEGAYLEDDKGLSNWDVFSHIPGKIKDNGTGDIADDHYHLFLEDIELMHSLGVNAYRFSISWTRILPKGKSGDVNPRGIMFYNKIIDSLLLRGIQPFVTMFHHDIPQELEDIYGSWLSSHMQEEFAYFAVICFKSFGDRVKYWTTMNEPNLLTEMACIRSWYPPSRCSLPFGNCSVGNSEVEPLVALHNMILAHGKAVRVYRDNFQARQGGLIGIVAFTEMFEPFRDNELDRQAVNRTLAYTMGWLLDPLVYGDYPAIMRQYLGSALPKFLPEEIDYVKGSLDFIGINHYTTLYAKDCIHSPCILGADRAIRGYAYTNGERDGVPIGERCANPRFFVVPEGLEKTVNYIKDRYQNMPMFVTENGYSPPQQNEQALLHDEKRVHFHKSYLASLSKAIRDGADVRGYFIWSLVDNFEWIDGYSMRYGIHYVDRVTLERRPKLSAIWYRNFLTNNGSRHNNEEDLASKSLENTTLITSVAGAAKYEI